MVIQYKIMEMLRGNNEKAQRRNTTFAEASVVKGQNGATALMWDGNIIQKIVA